ncbi:hypothetical protein BDE02_14G150200 [Populus trichocarpa]|nr:hypothetical protein BDE02_14G150200 [Populus trichocarpa]
MACISSSIASIFSSVIALLKLSGSLSAKKQNRVVSSMTCVASYNSSRFLILLGPSDDEDVAAGGVDDDAPGVFLLLNTGNLCTGLCGSAAGIITGLCGSAVGTIACIPSFSHHIPQRCISRFYH